MAGPDNKAAARICGSSYTSVAWFKDRWILVVDGIWFVSPDGMTWTENPVPDGSGPGAATLKAGPDTLLAEVWNSLWYSENGTDWTEVPEPSEPRRRGPSDATAYSDSFGYVATPWSDPGLYVSRNGWDWQYSSHFPDVDYLTASGDRAFGVGEFGTPYLLLYTESAESN